jgi:hypothetical protein
MARTNEIFLIDGDAVMKRTGSRPAGVPAGSTVLD